MKSSEDFKQAIREGKLNEALAIAISKVPELKITTSITSSSPDKDTENNSESKNPEPIKRLHTRINLVEGEIHNEISEELMKNGTYQEIQQFHFEQVGRGHQIIEKNLESLQNMFRMMTTMQKQRLEGNYHDIQYLEAKASPLLSEQQQVEEDCKTSISDAQHNLLEATNNIEEPSNLLENEYSQNNSNGFVKPQQSFQEHQDEDWGEWLDEEEQDIDVDLLDLSSLELDESEEWEEWEGEETQLFAGVPASSSEENKEQNNKDN